MPGRRRIFRSSSQHCGIHLTLLLNAPDRAAKSVHAGDARLPCLTSSSLPNPFVLLTPVNPSRDSI